MVSAAEIRFVKSLRERSARVSEGLFVAEGDKLISELLNSSLKVNRLFTTAESRLNFTSEQISPAQMERLSHLRSATTSLALIEIPQPSGNQRKKGLTLVLDGVQDPGNIGTIIRLAHWFGIEQVYCSPDCADCYGPKVVQATMGAIGNVEVIYCDIVDFLEKQKSCGVSIFGAFLERSEDIYRADLRTCTDAIVVMGSEGRGISTAVESVIDRRLHIPSFATGSGSESLNVGVATAIVVSEFRR